MSQEECGHLEYLSHAHSLSYPHFTMRKWTWVRKLAQAEPGSGRARIQTQVGLRSYLCLSCIKPSAWRTAGVLRVLAELSCLALETEGRVGKRSLRRADTRPS